MTAELIVASLHRIGTVVRRHILLYSRSPMRLLDLLFWPVMELFLWGFLTVYFRGRRVDEGGRLLLNLMNAVVLWDVLYRSQQSVSLAFMEELWMRNVMNLFVSPLRVWEWVAGACVTGLVRVTFVVILLFGLAAGLYGFDPRALGLRVVPYAAELLSMGWAMGLFTTGILLRWGYSAEGLIWAIPFLVQPFSAIFYPLSVYPPWLRPICALLPSTHVMEGVRRSVETGVFAAGPAWTALALDAAFLAAGALYCARMLENGRVTGRIVRMTE